MKLYRYQIGVHDRFGVAKDQKDAFERREKIDPSFAYLPVEITEVTVDGYEITLTATKAEKGAQKALEGLDRDGLKAWLTERNIEFTPQWGEAKLRELALSHV